MAIDDPTNKYVLFRNYMANELGITREDIKQWTVEAVEGQVSKLIGQLNLSERIDRSIDKLVKAHVAPSSYNVSDNVKQAVKEVLFEMLDIRVKEKK